MQLKPQPWGEAHEWLDSPEGQRWSEENFHRVQDSFWEAGRREVFHFFFSMKSSGTDGSWRGPWNYSQTIRLPYEDVDEQVAALSSPA